MSTLLGYRIEETLAATAGWTLHRAIDRDSSRHVLIKTLDAEFPTLDRIARLHHDYEIARHIDLDGVARPVELIRDGHRHLEVIEDRSGRSLRSLMSSGELTIYRGLEIVHRLALVVAGLHRARIIHKDLNPDVVLVGEDGVMLVDFGVASRMSRESHRIGGVERIEGTLSYISPEQSGRLNRPVDNRTDLYSLGAIMYEILSGAPPFVADDPMELIHAHIARTPAPLGDEMPEAIAAIVSKLLAKSADDRYQTARGLAYDLEACLEGLGSDDGIGTLRLAERDISDSLVVPTRLYGRAREVAELSTAFERARDGHRGLILVSGYSGIGKTMLVHEIRGEVARSNGSFIAGKFDALERSTPYAAFLSAFTSLVRQLLAGSEESIERWRHHLLERLGQYAPVICEAVPDLELLIGSQPPPSPLGAAEARNRFVLAWQSFVSALAVHDHPLLLVLDDLQWADLGSIQLLHQLFVDRTPASLLVVGTYRSNEVDESHALAQTLAQMTREEIAWSRIVVDSLPDEALEELVADTLRRPVDEVHGLAEAIGRKTAGNPFFVMEFLQRVHAEGFLFFDPAEHRWRWELDRIEAMGTTDNVVDLVAERIQTLPQGTQEVLKLAAVIGNSFDLATLAAMSGRSIAETAADVRHGMQEGMLRGSSDLALTTLSMEESEHGGIFTHSFTHDRIQQAAKSLVPTDELATTHGRIGAWMLSNIESSDTPLDGRIFDIVNHLNLDSPSARSQADRLRLAELNRVAARRARSSMAPEAARSYARTGIELLDDDRSDHYRLAFDLGLLNCESEYLLGNADDALALCRRLADDAVEADDRLAVDTLAITLYTNGARYAEALATGIEAARRLGMRLPAKPSQAHIITEFMKAKVRVGRRDIDTLIDLPMASDRRVLSLMNLLMEMIAPAMLSRPELGILIALRMFNLSLRHGNTMASPFGYMIYGVVTSGTGGFDLGYRMGELARRLNRRLGNSELEPVLTFLFATAINHWKRPARTNIDLLLSAYQSALESGNMIYADYSLITITVDSYCSGERLEETWRYCEQYFDFYRRVRGRVDRLASPQAQAGVLQQQMIRCLQGETSAPGSLDSEEFDSARDRAALTENLPLFAWYGFRLQAGVLFGKFDEAVEAAVEGKSVVDAVRVTGDVRMGAFSFNHALALASASLPPRQARSGVGRELKQLSKWAASSPENFQHKADLVGAEAARLDGDVAQAMRLYDAAIDGARRHGFVDDEGLASELAARFHLRRGATTIAAAYIRQADYCYRQWGAHAKVEQLDKEFHQLLGRDASEANSLVGNDNATIDLTAVFRAAQSISGEIVLEELLRKIMRTVIATAGAERGYLIFPGKSGLVIESESQIGVEEVEVLRSIPIDDVPEVSSAVVAYVARTHDSVLLHDAMREGLFVADETIVARGARSILCHPLMAHGELVGILYLENNLTSHAFTPERLRVLTMLAAPAAVSITNAILFRNQVALTNAASNFVPHEFLQFLGRESLVDVHLGEHVEMEMSVLFADIRSFTKLSEQMTPQRNFDFINAYLRRISPMVREHGGFIDKYLGDGIMALFPGSAEDAIDAAIAIQREVARFNVDIVANGEKPIAVGIGLHSGSLMLGIIGEAHRMDSTVISDAVNTAARLEGLTKIYGCSIIVSDELVARLSDLARYRHRTVDRVQILGRQGATTIYEIIDGAPSEQRELKSETLEEYSRALDLYHHRSFTEALQSFERVMTLNPGDRAAHILHERARHYIDHGVPEDWSGVEVLREK